MCKAFYIIYLNSIQFVVYGTNSVNQGINSVDNIHNFRYFLHFHLVLVASQMHI